MTIDYIEKAQQDTLAELLTWVQQVVEGRGESISQMVVSVVLGCVPGVGQAIDAYNILRSLYQLIRDSDSADNWLELVLCLIALVPGFGDALKNVFRMLRNGKAMARILDSLPATVRGNIEKWFRELNWVAYTAELIASTNRILDGLIDLFSTRVARWVLDKQGLQRLVAQLKALKSKATQKITEAMDSLQVAHQHAMAQPIPNTTAHVPSLPNAPHNSPPGSHAPSPKPAGSQAPRQPDRQAPQSGTKPQDLPVNTGGTATPRQGQASAQQRQSERTNYTRHRAGVLGEHIADYYFVRNKQSRKKINNHGVLYQGRQPGHHGIDHVWYSNNLPHQYRISDTKGTNEPWHKKLENMAAVRQALLYGLEHIVDDDDEAKVRNSVGTTKGDGRQMSHVWVAKKIRSAQIHPDHADLIWNIQNWESTGYNTEIMQCPYDRSVITVVGPNFALHDKNATTTKARTQLPAAGKCKKAATRHQISVEFLLPVNLLQK